MALKLSKAGRTRATNYEGIRQEAKKCGGRAESGRMHGYAETEASPCVAKARNMIEQGGPGRVLGPFASRISASSSHFWDVDKTGGGALNDLGCHRIEAARYFFGKAHPVAPKMVSANLVQEKTKGEDNALDP